jgi:hypothetical protein
MIFLVGIVTEVREGLDDGRLTADADACDVPKPGEALSLRIHHPTRDPLNIGVKCKLTRSVSISIISLA